MTVSEAIAYIRQNDCDFITPDTLRAYTGCTDEEARAGIVAVFGAEWMARQDAAELNGNLSFREQRDALAEAARAMFRGDPHGFHSLQRLVRELE